jgi:hypothetical protein
VLPLVIRLSANLATSWTSANKFFVLPFQVQKRKILPALRHPMNNSHVADPSQAFYTILYTIPTQTP